MNLACSLCLSTYCIIPSSWLYIIHSEVLRFQLVHKFPECSQLLPSVSLSACVCVWCSFNHPNHCIDKADYSMYQLKEKHPHKVYNPHTLFLPLHSNFSQSLAPVFVPLILRELDRSTAPYAALICTSRAGGQSPQPSATCQKPTRVQWPWGSANIL